MKKYYRLLAGLIVASAVWSVSNALADTAAGIIAAGANGTVTYDNASGAYPVITAIYSQPGTVNGRTYTGWAFFVADSTGSIEIYGALPSGSYTPAVGDAVSITGSYAPYSGTQPEINPVTAITLQSTGNTFPFGLPYFYDNIQQFTNTTGTLPASNICTAPIIFRNVTLWSDLAGTTPPPAVFNAASGGNTTLYAKDSAGNVVEAYHWASSYSDAGKLAGLSIPTGLVSIAGFLSKSSGYAPEIGLMELVGIGPLIGNVPNQYGPTNTVFGPIAFTVSSTNTAANIVVTASSSQTSVIANGSPSIVLTMDGSGTNRTITLTPQVNVQGLVTITINAYDPGSTLTSQATFNVCVGCPDFVNGGPANTIVPENATPKTNSLPFTVWDYETPTSLTVSVLSCTDTNLLPLSNIKLSGTGTNLVVSVTPKTGTNGYAFVTLQVVDPTPLTNTAGFYVTVPPHFGVLASDNFNAYGNDLLIGDVANTQWLCTGQCDSNDFFIVSGKAQIASTNYQDVGLSGPAFSPWLNLPVAFGSTPFQFTANHGDSTDTLGNSNISGGVLYSSFTLNATVLPQSNGTYFAHFRNTGSGQSGVKARVFVTTNSAAAGKYRVGIAENGYVVTAIVPKDLSLGTNYTVASRYNVSSGDSTVWVNPTDEGDLSASEPYPDGGTSYIVSYGLANTYGGAVGDTVGVLYVDNLILGTAFTDVIPATAPTVTTAAATGVTAYAATLNGSVDPNGADTSAYFQYGTTTAYTGGYSTTNTFVAGSGSNSIPAFAISGLNSGTTYHFQAVGKNSVGTTLGADKTFTTVSVAPLSPQLNYTFSAGTLSLNWSASGFGVYSSSSPVGPRSGWSLVGSTSPVTVTPLSNGSPRYYTLWGTF